MLTSEQVEHFQTFGCIVLKDWLSQQEIAVLRGEFEHAMRISYVGNEFDGTERHWIPMMGPAAPSFGKLAGDPRFLETAQELTGNDVMFMAVDANRYVGDTFWHSDGGAARAVKFVFYLESVGTTTGALRVLPMSHIVNGSHGAFPDEYQKQLYQQIQAANDTADYTAIPSHVLESEPGDVVVFDPHCYHASVGGRPGRPMCTVSYYPVPAVDDEWIELLKVVQEANIKQYGATDVSQVLDMDWFASQQWGEGHKQVIDTLRRLGRIPSAVG